MGKSLDLCVLAIFLAATLGLGALAARRRRAGLADYALAGRTLTLPLFAATLVPTFYGGVLGIGEFAWKNGLSNWLVMAFPYYVFAAAYAFLLAGKVRAASGLTIPDHLEAAYGRPLALLGALLVFLLACPADEFLMIGTILAHLAGVGLGTGMLLSAALMATVLWRGGLRSDVWSNALQFCIMFAGFAIILPSAHSAVGPWTTLQNRLPAGHVTLSGGLTMLQVISWWLLASWTFVDPAFHQRCAAAETPATARRGILVSILFWALFDLMTTAAGLYARALLPTLERPLMAFPLMADRLLSPLLRGLFYAGLCASTLAALQATTLIAALSLGKDGLARWKNSDEAAAERWSQLGLLAAAGTALLLAWSIPSVVGLWYAVGSSTIPGLMLPVLGAYFPSMRARPRTALIASVLGWATATASSFGGFRPWGLEPLVTGLIISAGAWFFSFSSHRQAHAQ